MSDLASPLPGGRRDASIVPADKAAKLRRLEEESERLRRQIDERKKVVRQEVREWDGLGRQAEKFRLAGELAEGNRGVVEGMGVGGGYVPVFGNGKGAGKESGEEKVEE